MTKPPTTLAVERVILNFEKKIYNPVMSLLRRMPDDDLDTLVRATYTELRLYYQEVKSANDPKEIHR